MKTFFAQLMFVSLAALYPWQAVADLDPVVRKCFDEKTLDGLAQVEIDKYVEKNLHDDGDDFAFNNDQLTNSQFEASLTKAEGDACSDRLDEFFKTHRSDLQFHFEVVLNLAKLSVNDKNSLPVDLRAYKDGQSMTVYFSAAPTGCHTECPTREVTFGEKTVKAGETCHLKVDVTRTTEYSTDAP